MFVSWKPFAGTEHLGGPLPWTYRFPKYASLALSFIHGGMGDVQVIGQRIAFRRAHDENRSHGGFDDDIQRNGRVIKLRADRNRRFGTVQNQVADPFEDAFGPLEDSFDVVSGSIIRDDELDTEVGRVMTITVERDLQESAPVKDYHDEGGVDLHYPRQQWGALKRPDFWRSRYARRARARGVMQVIFRPWSSSIAGIQRRSIHFSTVRYGRRISLANTGQETHSSPSSFPFTLVQSLTAFDFFTHSSC